MRTGFSGNHIGSGDGVENRMAYGSDMNDHTYKE